MISHPQTAPSKFNSITSYKPQIDHITISYHFTSNTSLTTSSIKQVNLSIITSSTSSYINSTEAVEIYELTTCYEVLLS